MSRYRLVGLVAVALLWMSLPARAQTPPLLFLYTYTLPDVHEYSFNFPLPGAFSIYRDGIVGYSGIKNGAFTGPRTDTVTFLPGGAYTNNLFVYQDSIVNIDGGRVMKSLILQDNSTANLISGSVDSELDAFGHSHVNMSPGTSTGGSLYAYTSSNVAITGATVGGNLVANNDSTTVVSGGTVGGVTTTANATVTLSNSTVRIDAVAAGLNSRINLLNSMVGFGGFGSLQARGNGNITVAGGAVKGDITVQDHGTVSFSAAADIRGSVFAGDDGVLNADSTTIHGDFLVEGRAFANVSNNTQIDGSLVSHHDTTFLGNFGGSVGGDVNIFEQSTVALTKFGIDGNAIATDTGILNLYDTHVSGFVYANTQSKIQIDALSRVEGEVYSAEHSLVTNQGIIIGGVTVNNNASFFMSDGRVGGRIAGAGDATIFLTGGSANEAEAAYTSKLTMSGQVLDHDLKASDSGTVTLLGGRVGGDLVVQDFGTANMAGGYVAGTLQLSGNGVFNRSGGTFGLEPPALSGGGSISQLSEESSAGQSPGGMLGPGLIGFDSSTINLIGTGLEAILVDPNFEDMFSAYELVGKLADGTPIDGQFLYIQNETGASFQLIEVPEPGSFVLASLATFGALLGRRRKSHR